MFFIDGSYVNQSDAKISVLDLGLLRGYGVFDYLRTYSKKPFHLIEHLLRLQYSAKQLNLQLPYSLEEISAIIYRLLDMNEFEEASIKIVVTGGISSDQFTPQEVGSLFVFAYPLSVYPKEYFTQGITAVTTTQMRSLAQCKTTQYTPGILAIQQGKNIQAKEALYINADKEILEATTSNFFGVKEGQLFTCLSDAVLAGITREIVLKLVKDRYSVVAEPIRLDQLDTLDEAFITASNKEIMPVVQIDDQIIGNGQVGKITQEIMQLFRSYTQLPDWPALEIPRYNTKQLLSVL